MSECCVPVRIDAIVEFIDETDVYIASVRSKEKETYRKQLEDEKTFFLNRRRYSDEQIEEMLNEPESWLEQHTWWQSYHDDVRKLSERLDGILQVVPNDTETIQMKQTEARTISMVLTYVREMD